MCIHNESEYSGHHSCFVCIHNCCHHVYDTSIRVWLSRVSLHHYGSVCIHNDSTIYMFMTVTRARRPRVSWIPSSTSSPRTLAVEEARPVKLLSTDLQTTCWTSYPRITSPLRWLNAYRRWGPYNQWTSSCARKLTACRRSLFWCVPPWMTSNWPLMAQSSWVRIYEMLWTACTTLVFPTCGGRWGFVVWLCGCQLRLL